MILSALFWAFIRAVSLLIVPDRKSWISVPAIEIKCDISGIGGRGHIFRISAPAKSSITPMTKDTFCTSLSFDTLFRGLTKLPFSMNILVAFAEENS